MIFLRHPTPDATPGLCYGRMDLGLAPGAEAQIEGALQTVPRGLPVVTSPARRCLALADALAERDRVVPQQDPRLWEMHFGSWEGLMWGDVPRHESDPWAEDAWNLAPPGGESFAAVCTRVEAAILGAPEDSIIVAHAGVIRAAQMILEGQSLDQVFAVPVPYATPITMARKAA